MTLFLFSLIGMPLTAGFAGKLQLFVSSLSVPFDGAKEESVKQARLFIALAVIMAVNAAVGGWYYLRLIAVMYLREDQKDVTPAPAPEGPRSAAVLWGVGLCAVVTLFLGVYPAPMQEAARRAVRGSVEPTPLSGGGGGAPAAP
jgi:NADH-quinone oxidoreductase subunit N